VPRSLSSVLPLAALIAVAAILALAVNRIASPAGLPQFPRPSAVYDYGNPTIRTGGRAYPRTAQDANDFVVRMARPARRIASANWSFDEFVYTVAPPERVVAVSESAYLASVSNIYHFAEQFHPAIATDAERVLRLEPDLAVVSSESRADFTNLLKAGGVPVYRMFVEFSTLQQVEEAITLTGYLTGEDEAARRERTRFHEAIERARRLRRAGTPRPRILGFSSGLSYGSQTLFHDIVKTLDGTNVGAEGGLKSYDRVNSEQIARWDPEWIISGADPGKTKEALTRLLADPGIAATRAARNGRILVFENHVFLPLSPFTTLLVTAMAEAIYGGDLW
jgi:iron complex transport system substrate-binding protein